MYPLIYLYNSNCDLFTIYHSISISPNNNLTLDLLLFYVLYYYLNCYFYIYTIYLKKNIIQKKI